MIPQLGPVPPPAPAPSLPSDPAAKGDVAGPARGSPPEGVETARAIEPPLPATSTDPQSQAERRSLNPPDPKAPAGPPPAFEASILDRAREEASAPPDLRQTPPTNEPTPALVAVPAPPEPASAPTADVETALTSSVRPAEDAAALDPLIRAPSPEGVSAEPSSAEQADTEPEGGAQASTEAEAGRGSYDVPPSAEQRAESGLATIRRIETPYDTATVDVSR